MNKLLVFDLQGTLVSGMRPPILNGSLTTLETLSQKYNLAIFTGASTGETVNILKKLNITRFFSPENIITKGQFPRKPNPQAILWLISRNRPPFTYYLGDTRKDLRTATAAKIPFIYVGRQKPGILQINSLDQLLDVKINL